MMILLSLAIFQLSPKCIHARKEPRRQRKGGSRGLEKEGPGRGVGEGAKELK